MTSLNGSHFSVVRNKNISNNAAKLNLRLFYNLMKFLIHALCMF